MNWFVYIAKSRFSHYYTGITKDVEERIKSHNVGNGSQMAKQQGPFKLMYKSVAYMNKSTARKREIQIKKWTRLKKDKLIRGEWK
ncbi:MAG: GIY-YIG nuclease family protein [Minisyncoccia bacterium]